MKNDPLSSELLPSPGRFAMTCGELRIGALGRTVRQKETRREAGFTLVELLVVLAILGLLAAMVTPQVLRYLGRAKLETARIEMRNMSTALDLFLVDVGRYPTQQEGLQALVIDPGRLAGWHGPYLKSRASGIPIDPWGHPYQYRFPSQTGDYDLFSNGPENTPIAGAGTTTPTASQ
jgi:general secretion pathway protein G